jgi:hypothetical protein
MHLNYGNQYNNALDIVFLLSYDLPITTHFIPQGVEPCL